MANSVYRFLKSRGGVRASALCLVLSVALLAFGLSACGKKAPPEPLDSKLKTVNNFEVERG